MPGDVAPARTTFRLPRTAYLAAAFVLIGVLPFAIGGGLGSPGSPGSATLTPRIVLFVLPIAVAGFIARAATVVDDTGITARALIGKRVMPWTQVRGLSVRGSTVYAVLDDGIVRLPCVQTRNLAALSEASGDRLPAVRRPVPKQPPGARRRR